MTNTDETIASLREQLRNTQAALLDRGAEVNTAHLLMDNACADLPGKDNYGSRLPLVVRIGILLTERGAK